MTHPNDKKDKKGKDGVHIEGQLFTVLPSPLPSLHVDEDDTPAASTGRPVCLDVSGTSRNQIRQTVEEYSKYRS